VPVDLPAWIDAPSCGADETLASHGTADGTPAWRIAASMQDQFSEKCSND